VKVAQPTPSRESAVLVDISVFSDGMTYDSIRFMNALMRKWTTAWKFEENI
jgi:hypothetical protein